MCTSEICQLAAYDAGSDTTVDHMNGGTVKHIRALRNTLAAENGEGVISVAIAILIIAFLGVAMWLAFDALLTETTGTISNQVQQIGG